MNIMILANFLVTLVVTETIKSLYSGISTYIININNNIVNKLNNIIYFVQNNS